MLCLLTPRHPHDLCRLVQTCALLVRDRPKICLRLGGLRGAKPARLKLFWKNRTALDSMPQHARNFSGVQRESGIQIWKLGLWFLQFGFPAFRWMICTILQKNLSNAATMQRSSALMDQYWSFLVCAVCELDMFSRPPRYCNWRDSYLKWRPSELGKPT